MMSNCEYVRNHYGVPACIGRRVEWRGKQGIIAEDMGHYVGVNFDEDKPNVVLPIHPTDDNLIYLGMGIVRKMTRAQKRYRDWLNSDSDWTFGEWIKYRCYERDLNA